MYFLEILLGTFNGWQKMRMSRSQKDFVAMVELGEGDHEYKFMVDGQWLTDPNVPVIENEAGFKNNVIHVQKEDFDAFEALDMDLATVAKAQSHKTAKANSIKPQTCYGQEMPQTINGSGIPISGDPRTAHSGPPILPPHLLQVILNKVQCTKFISAKICLKICLTFRTHLCHVSPLCYQSLIM